MTIEEAEAAYKAVSTSLLLSFQEGRISFQEWARRHSENCDKWRTHMTEAIEGEQNGQ